MSYQGGESSFYISCKTVCCLCFECNDSITSLIDYEYIYILNQLIFFTIDDACEIINYFLHIDLPNTIKNEFNEEELVNISILLVFGLFKR